MAKSDNLRKAKEAKNDEFYTQLDDIVSEIAQHKDYVRQFQGKTVFCNCDDPEWSSFVEFFRKFFKKLGLKKMICTHYEKDGSPSYKLEWSGEKINGDTVNMIKTPLKGNGDFRSEECIELLKEADIVVTNPPFSLYREYIAQLMEYGKQFVILGNPNSIAYKEVFPLLRDGKLFIGYKSMGSDIYFKVSEEQKQIFKATGKEGSNYVIKNGEILGRAQAVWFTNLDLDKSHEPLPLTKNYKGNEDRYPNYYNYDAIDVGSVADIPKDYYGKMGVPITYMSAHCAEQFEIVGIGSDVSKTKEHIAYKDKGIICYEQNGVAVWTTPYTVSERKIGNSLRVERDNLPANAPYNRIIIQRKPILQED